jgi:DnaJ-class molecular chaperone
MSLADYINELDLLGISNEKEIRLIELKKNFKKKSLAMLPEKHPTIANAHSQFEEVNEAFVKVFTYLNIVCSILYKPIHSCLPS